MRCAGLYEASELGPAVQHGRLCTEEAVQVVLVQVPVVKCAAAG